MANLEHLNLIKKGVDIWNAWREDMPDIQPDLSQADLRGEKFQKINLSRGNLTECKLQFSNLTGADLREANLTKSKLQEACPNGGELTIRTQALDSYVEVAIKDTGQGIKQKHMAKIFEPFFTTKGEVKGTGLGLSVSYGIIKKHGGDLKVRSAEGEGSQFIITLPIKAIGQELD